jgi:methyl-CpG-binding domain protein 4
MSTNDRSPFDLVQEFAASVEPAEWRVMVACLMLNRTHGRQVRPMVTELFERAPTPEAAVRAVDAGELDHLLRPLGFINRRKRALRAMAVDYCAGKRRASCYGTGDYCTDSLRIFVDGETDVATDDPWLKKYLEWRNSSATEELT